MATYGELLDRGDFVATSVCADCLMIADGYGSEIDYRSPDWTLERIATMQRNLRRYDVTVGHVHSGEWASRCYHAGEDCADDCNCTYSEFSWSRCGLCDTGLGGSRHDVIMVEFDGLD